MCGIAGTSYPFGRTPFEGLVEEILESQLCRGPDWTGIERAAGRRLSSVIGHNRLSIIDLSASANQPMWNADRSRCLSYNGESYNYIELRQELRDRGHSFRTQSDTEVVLAAYDQWGTDAFRRLNGFFALAILDVKADEIILVRDRFGVKPLYYVFRGDQMSFASTAKVLATSYALEPDLQYVAGGLRYGFFDDANVAPFRGMSVVRPGTAVHITVGDEGKLIARESRYYEPEERVAALIDSLASQDAEAQTSEVASLLEDAVRLRLRSDVPVAVSLSGGLDSTSIASIAHSQSPGSIRGFCFGDPNDASTEGPLVASFARDTGIEVRFVRPSASEIANSFCATLDAQGAPFGSGSVMAQYLLYRGVNQNGVRVLLGGQGGDEAFMGYRKFYPLHLKELFTERRVLEALLFLLPTAQMLLAEVPQATVYWAELYRYRSAPVRNVLDLPAVAPANLTLQRGEPLWRRQLRDVTTLSLPTLLRYEDRNSMAHSVESRLPFLDYRLMELALALPTATKLRRGYGKWILRAATSKHVPTTIRTMRLKRGFDVRQEQWIDLGLGRAIRRQFAEQSGKANGWLRAGSEISDVFSDRRLKGNPRAFAEAAALLWLVKASS